jgi:hypothetical protein
MGEPRASAYRQDRNPDSIGAMKAILLDEEYQVGAKRLNAMALELRGRSAKLHGRFHSLRARSVALRLAFDSDAGRIEALIRRRQE